MSDIAKTICAHCHAKSSVKKLKACAACNTTFYCSHECQKSDWLGGENGGHRKLCTKSKPRHLSQEYCEEIVQGLINMSGNLIDQCDVLDYVQLLAARNIRDSKSLGIAGMCEAIIDVMKFHPDQGHLISYCLSAMTMLCRNFENNKRFVDLGGCALVTSAIRDHGLDPDVTQICFCIVVDMITANPTTADALSESGACVAIMSLFRQLFENDDQKSEDYIQSLIYGLKAIACLCGSLSSYNHIFSDACGMITNLMRSYINHAHFLGLACNAVANLVTYNSTNIESLHSSGITELVIRVMDSLEQHEGICVSPLGLINKISQNEVFINEILLTMNNLHV